MRSVQVCTAFALAGIGCAPLPRTGTPPPAPDLEACRREVAGLRQKVDSHERSLRTQRAVELFAEGQPQPAAARAVEPLVLAELARRHEIAPALALECRTWVCLGRVRATGKRPNPLGFSVEKVGARVQWARIGGVRRDLDPATGQSMTAYQLWLVLHHPAGDERTQDQLRREAVTAKPMPADDASCRAELAELRPAEGALVAELEARALKERPELAFNKGAPNLALEERMAAELLRVLGEPRRPAPEVFTCRGQVCRLERPVSEDSMKALRNDDRFWGQVDRAETIVGGVVGGVVGGAPTMPTGPPSGGMMRIFAFFPEPRANGRRLVLELFQQVESSLARCKTQAPRRGGLTVRLELPATAMGGPRPKMSASYEGSLEGTRLGACVQRIVEEKTKATPLPQPVSGYSLAKDFLFDDRVEVFPSY